MCLKHADEHDEGEVDDEVDGTRQGENLENRECLAHQALCISRDLENRDCRGKARTLDDEDQLIAVSRQSLANGEREFDPAETHKW